VRTFLLFLNTEQKIDTVEHGLVRGLAIANIAACESRALAKEYMDIVAGDEIIGCNDLPDIINTRGSGFKQGALAKLLTDAQVEELASGLN